MRKLQDIKFIQKIFKKNFAMACIGWIGLTVVTVSRSAHAQTIELTSGMIEISDALASHESMTLALTDFRNLWEQAFTQSMTKDIRIHIEDPLPKKSDGSEQSWDHYRISSQALGGRQIKISIRADSVLATTYALYGFLQNQLGFSFIHPRQTVIPKWPKLPQGDWPLAETGTWEGQARFESRGFHLHTMHPIELADALHDADFPGGVERIKEYFDWMARNGQNAFQFHFLRTIDNKKYPAYAKKWIKYGQSRGIKVGVSFSLAMFQQKAWRAVNMTKAPWTYHFQLKSSLKWLFQMPWDFAAVDFTTGEYFPDIKSISDKLRKTLIDTITQKYHVKVFHKVHVIPEPDPDPSEISKTSIQVHTTMCYSMTEEKAPIYGFQNQKHIYERLKKEAATREAWYFPESAYWVTFDISVPMTLLPYLDTRLSDILTSQQVGAKGHITFSSGWEWGYWLVDWMIARWSWQEINNGVAVVPTAMDGIEKLFQNPEVTATFNEVLKLQNLYLKEHELLRYLPPSTPMDEAIGKLTKPFQPSPKYTYSELMRLGPVETKWVRDAVLSPMDEFANKNELLMRKLKQQSSQSPPLISRLGSRLEGQINKELLAELIRGLEMTGLRARHRHLTMSAILDNHEPTLPFFPKPGVRDQVLRAEEIRAKGIGIVREQEAVYRYPVAELATKHKDKTAYHFGYLYPVHDLHFWKREERQVISKRFDVFYMNIWNFPRILGVEF